MKLFILVFVFIGVCYCKLRLNDFSIELLHFTQLQTDGHVLLSPYGIWTLLTGIKFGTSGDSYSQTKRALFLYKNETKLTDEYKDLAAAVLMPSNKIILENFNFVFIANNFSIYPSFRKKLVNDFGMFVKFLDFRDPNVEKIANSYIETISNHVSNVLKSDDFEKPSMILVNAINIKGSLFNQVELIKEPFYNEDNKAIGNVIMMFVKGQFPFSNIKTLKSYAVELPYENGTKYSFIVLLPYPSVKISDIYQKFSSVSLNDIFKKLNDDVNTFGLEDVHVKLPRFRISTNVVLNKPLYDMGVYDIFQPDLSNFKRGTNDNIYVSSVIHNANIDVSVVGNVTSIGTSSKTIPTPYFPINRPFLYYIVEKTTTTVIFSGIYSKPSFY